jgi:hypothetical protein
LLLGQHRDLRAEIGSVRPVRVITAITSSAVTMPS